ncbi:MAG: efflux RND transporter periplasmic adaptor subunit [Alphaproteobacteria bacterium]|jgi:multidrug resistance efflux pump|nr:efflux RND transporter periplasmic adaptor subunit [Alphaproteobacteria bacterium]
MAACLAAALLVMLTAPAHAQGQVGAIGEIAPSGGVISLSGTSGTSIQEILVETHQSVKAGDVLIVLSSHDLLKAERELAVTELEALKDLGEVKTRLLQATRKAARLALGHAKQALAEYEALGASAISKAELARRRNLAEVAESEVTVATLELKRLRQELAAEEAKAAIRRKLSEARYRSSLVVAPTDGTILAIQKQPGEHVGRGPVLLMADTSEMFVVCQVFEGDLQKIKEGMRATASSKSLPKALEGRIQRIDRIIDTSRKLAKVLIRLDAPAGAERLIGMEVQVSIHL